ncbi:fatty acid binding protein 1-B.1 [Penaeus vannamei]|uniref:Fatty acids binding protein n=2 Tax=Penaeus vannamei TaxID=6689 RepID=A0A3R7QBE6_PENVA|nr:fatty acid binding protein 1-B.1-like [Penaeus vannamei]XP_027233590.1 fatty acid binding protein 1-B.1-like [Penaeus vannamei]MDK2413143.1 hypothetical protein [Aphanizomenon sp. 202]ROT62499.1 fatty acids binding protein [Penaeus vannamei]ROT79684.1 fatty acids binding protein [Penaeus vannamei]
MSLAGTYEYASNENYSEWLSAVGIPAEYVAKMVAAKPVLEVSQNGNVVTIKTVAGDKSFTNTIKLGEESKASLPGGVEYTVSLSQSGNTLKGTWAMGGKSGDACVEVTGSNLIQSMSLGGVKAKRVYNRK